jgi:hypothetical protein
MEMRILRPAQILIAIAAFAACSVALAESPSAGADAVVIVGTKEDTWNCTGASIARARWLADKASRDGDYQRAGECYLAAGEPALADQAFVKAVGPAGTDTSKKLAANAEQVKAQARQIKLAFQRK